MRSLRSAALLLALLPVAVGARDRPAPVEADDPPAVVGEPYILDGVTLAPADAPFDDVGLAGFDAEAPGVSLSHRTLPLPSYAEVTALDSGRTILARVERRGPMTLTRLVDLSPAAFAQLGADPAAPLAVRVRRVSPQSYERSLLRTGQRAPERLATPEPLLAVLRKRLAATTLPARIASPPPEIVATPPAAPPPPLAATPAGYAVQAAAFASRERADATARKLGGEVGAAGRLWRVRVGPFAARAEAQAALAKVRRAGFADAQIVALAK